MSEKTITRSVRLDEVTNANLESLANAAGMTVSEYIRWAIAELSLREARVAGRRRALVVLSTLPSSEDPDAERDEIWGLGTRVPR